MAHHDDSLEDFWSDLKLKTCTPLVASLNNSVEGTLDLACAKTLHDIKQKYEPVMDPKTWNGLLEAVRDIIQRLKAHIYEDFRKRGPASLIEMVLVDTSLNPVELKGFVRALPESLVKRICEEGAAGSSAKGVHALLSFEWLYRTHPGRFTGDYTLNRRGDGVLEISIQPAGSGVIVFRLDDTFDMSDFGVGSK